MRKAFNIFMSEKKNFYWLISLFVLTPIALIIFHNIVYNLATNEMVINSSLIISLTLVVLTILGILVSVFSKKIADGSKLGYFYLSILYLSIVYFSFSVIKLTEQNVINLFDLIKRLLGDTVPLVFYPEIYNSNVAKGFSILILIVIFIGVYFIKLNNQSKTIVKKKK
jgi:hypothetical protein